MTKEQFVEKLQLAVAEMASLVHDSKGNWTVKGFIDIEQMIYTISADTKVISKILELYIFPRLVQFSQENELEIKLPGSQNTYPDITFKDKDGHLFAVDLKTSYRKDNRTINGMTLGTFTGYFRKRDSKDHITCPYQEYCAHLVLGVIYSRTNKIDERRCYKLNELKDIKSVAHDFQFFVQEKWRIASDIPGSGNTKNIGSVKDIDALVNGNGVFASLGESYFDDYWMHYLTKEMAHAAELASPYYYDISSYKKFKHLE